MHLATAVKIISLETSHDRRRLFNSNASHSALKYDFHDAYTELAAPLEYQERDAIRRFGRPLSRGEIGCYTSHFKIWEWLVASNYAQLIVLEDDVLVDWSLIGRLAEFDMGRLGVDFLRLGGTHPFRSESLRYNFAGQHYHLVRAQGYFLGTQGYLVTRAGARALMMAGRRINAPVDWVLARYWSHGLPPLVLFPFPLVEIYSLPSVIKERENVPFQFTKSDRYHRLKARISTRLQKARTDYIGLRHLSFGKPISPGADFLTQHESCRFVTALDAANERERRVGLGD
jgi:glycosyl transferase family 25